MENDDHQGFTASQPLLGSTENENLFEGVQLEEPTAPDVPPPVAHPPPEYSHQPQPVDGYPYGVSLGHAQGSDRAQGIMHIPDLPDAVAEWKNKLPLLRSWMYLSIATLIISFLFFWPGVLPGLLSVVAASMHVCKCCQGNPSLAGPIQTTYILAMLVVVIDSLFCALIALQMFIIVGTGCDVHEERRDGEDGIFEEEVDEEGGPNAVKCLVLIAVLTMMLTWYSVHTAISVRVMQQARRMTQLLNPISSGMMVL